MGYCFATWEIEDIVLNMLIILSAISRLYLFKVALLR